MACAVTCFTHADCDTEVKWFGRAALLVTGQVKMCAWELPGKKSLSDSVTCSLIFGWQNYLEAAHLGK